MARLSDFCKINMGQSPDSTSYNENGNGLPFFQGNADFGELHPEVRVWCNAPTKIANPNDILISVRAPIGALNIADVQCCIGRGLAALTADNDKCTQKFLWYALQSKIEELNSKGTGSTFKAIGKSVLQETEIPLPTIAKQNEIAGILDNVMLLIKARKKQLIELEQLVKSRFIELFGDPIQNPKGWKTDLLKKATSKIGSGATPKGGKESYTSNGITLIRSMNVHDGRFEYKDLAHITDEQARQLDNVIVETNDVFINITGASVARSCIVPEQILPARVNQHVAIIRCVVSQLNPVFANNMFLNDSFKGQLLDIGESGGATRQAITKQQLETLTVILPPIELQNEFAAFVEHTDKLKFAVKESTNERQYYMLQAKLV